MLGTGSRSIYRAMISLHSPGDHSIYCLTKCSMASNCNADECCHVHQVDFNTMHIHASHVMKPLCWTRCKLHRFCLVDVEVNMSKEEMRAFLDASHIHYVCITLSTLVFVSTQHLRHFALLTCAATRVKSVESVY